MIEGMGSRNQAPFPQKKKRSKVPSKSSALTDEIIRFVKASGGAARRVNTQGQWDEDLRKWRPSGMKRGFEDIDATMRISVRGFRIGLKVAVEVKVGSDTQFDAQKKREKELTEAGGRYIIATELDQFKRDWANHSFTIEQMLK